LLANIEAMMTLPSHKSLEEPSFLNHFSVHALPLEARWERLVIVISHVFKHTHLMTLFFWQKRVMRVEWVGQNVIRKDAWDKVTGRAKFAADTMTMDTLFAALVTSPYAHAKILQVDVSQAEAVPGVIKVVTGEDIDILVGEGIRDRPILAKDKVRYYGEPIAVVIADSPDTARLAAPFVKAAFLPLPVVNSPQEAIQAHAPLVHEHLDTYYTPKHLRPIPGTNIAHHVKIRKGEADKKLPSCPVIHESRVSFPPSDHCAMETRTATVEIRPDGTVCVESSSQVPFIIKSLFSELFDIPQDKIVVTTPLVGGGYGGKSAVQLEFIAYIASRAVGGQKVMLTNRREEDFVTSPVHIGLDATVTIGCDDTGRFIAMKISYLFDGGAYSDKAVDICRAAAIDCTGPYRVDHVFCDAYCLYTNHPYPTAFRGFGHPELTFAVERCIDGLAEKLAMDPTVLRKKNIIQPGDTTPTQSLLNKSRIGNLTACLEKVKALIRWDEGDRIETENHTIRAKGVSCFWKTSNIGPNVSSGALLVFNKDGTVHLDCGVVEIGTGSRSVLAQIAAERLGIDVKDIHVDMTIKTTTTPEHYKTVASRGLWMAGRAVLRAADDALCQLFQIASQVLRVSPDDLRAEGGFIFYQHEPRKRLSFRELAYGYRYPNGNTIGGQVIGRGSFVLPELTFLDPDTGKGNPGPDWTVGAEAVEVEFNPKDDTYKILRAACVIDAGTIINPMYAEGQVRGGMHMGLSFASREGFVFTKDGIVMNNQFRTYKVLRYGENPEYLVDFVQTPSMETAYGLRGIGEHGVIGMPAALAASLSKASGVFINELPIIPELIWRLKRGR